MDGFASTAHVSALESACTLNNGPCVATLTSSEGAGLGMTPVYVLHAGHYESFMEGAVKDASDASKLHLSLTLNAGASLVRKTKTIAFALGPAKNGMEVDYPDIDQHDRPLPRRQREREQPAVGHGRVHEPASEATCSEHILAHTYHGAPDTVEVKPTQAALTGGWFDGVCTNYAGVPEIVVPIGQVEVFSPYTLRTESQPVTVALGMAKRCDLVLFELVDRLAALGLLKDTLPGKVAYPIGS
ncbi:hypothetical protein GE09DRAFT_1048175 [Coniochaeta sp. 2T2.1]|nr:hypothetical protein GE09DRAFT_1048175 [Coniochaeta sp. 2T2.1]